MAKPKLALIPSGVADDKMFSVLPSNGDGDFDFTRGSAATRVNSQGLIETVSNDLPRLNYPLLDGVVQECPSLLLEPSRTNKLSTSNDFNGSGWLMSDVTATANQVVSPDGTLNASKLEMTVNGSLRNQSQASFNDGYAYSIFIKKGNSRYVTIRSAFFTQSIVVGFDLDTLTTQTNGKIEDYGNDWYRLSITKDISGDADKSGFFYLYLPNSLGSQTSESGNYAYFYGGQIEDGSYPTSYIPTQGSTVTRLAETCNGAGTSDTFNDSEGVLMVETSALADDSNIEGISISDGSSSNRVVIFKWNSSNTVKVRVTSVGFNYVNENITVSDITDIMKIAVKYKQNNFSIFINGFELFTEDTGSTPIGLDALQFNSDGLGSAPFYGNTKQLQYFDTTDIDLETLTSWVSFQEMAQAQLYTIQ